MRLAANLAIAAIMAAGAQAQPATGRLVTVYLQNHGEVPSFVKGQAQRQASHMFAEIGVALVWKEGKPPISDIEAIAIELDKDTPASLAPGALASALPYEGIHIRVFWDRIDVDSARRNSATEAEAVLAHVMVHEITHILQGIARHSDEGIMKGRWTNYERATMRARPLHFTAWDVDLIFAGMDARDARTTRPAVTTLAANTTAIAVTAR